MGAWTHVHLEPGETINVLSNGAISLGGHLAIAAVRPEELERLAIQARRAASMLRSKMKAAA